MTGNCPYKQARISLEQVLQQSSSPNKWYNQGEMLANLGRYEEALVCFDKAVEVQPDDYAAWVFRGVVIIHLNRPEDALKSCNKALEIQNSDVQAWIFRGVALHRLGRYAEAYDSYNKALGIESSKWQKCLHNLIQWVMGDE